MTLSASAPSQRECHLARPPSHSLLESCHSGSRTLRSHRCAGSYSLTTSPGRRWFFDPLLANLRSSSTRSSERTAGSCCLSHRNHLTKAHASSAALVPRTLRRGFEPVHKALVHSRTCPAGLKDLSLFASSAFTSSANLEHRALQPCVLHLHLAWKLRPIGRSSAVSSNPPRL